MTFHLNVNVIEKENIIKGGETMELVWIKGTPVMMLVGVKSIYCCGAEDFVIPR